jgi:hypothetical protein
MALAIQPNDNEPLLRATYGAATVFTPAATPTLVWTMAGATGKTIKIKNLTLSAGGTSAGFMSVLLKRYTAAPTGGTSVAMPGIKHDTSDPAPSGSMAYWTVNPTPGAVVGILHGGRIGFSTGGQMDRLNWALTWLNDKAITLRGPTDIVGFDLIGGTVPAGGVLDIDVEWTEEVAGGPFDSQVTI